jgi:hypothetical protein
MPPVLPSSPNRSLSLPPRTASVLANTMNGILDAGIMYVVMPSVLSSHSTHWLLQLARIVDNDSDVEVQVGNGASLIHGF